MAHGAGRHHPLAVLQMEGHALPPGNVDHAADHSLLILQGKVDRL